jgi:hypothetical protein
MSALSQTLEQFKDKVNAHPRLRSLLKDWNRLVRIEALDSEEVFHAHFANTELTRIAPGSEDLEAEITLSATGDLLCKIFSGRENPASQYLTGSLQVFASDKDQVKLDAITLVLWD